MPAPRRCFAERTYGNRTQHDDAPSPAYQLIDSRSCRVKEKQLPVRTWIRPNFSSVAHLTPPNIAAVAATLGAGCRILTLECSPRCPTPSISSSSRVPYPHKKNPFSLKRFSEKFTQCLVGWELADVIVLNSRL
jgi:hypothetical protein